MCSYETEMANKRFQWTKKNRENGFIPKVRDPREQRVNVPCGTCLDCRSMKAAQWRVRLAEEMNENPMKAWFITLTIDEKEMDKLEEEFPEAGANEIASITIRRFNEKFRLNATRANKRNGETNPTCRKHFWVPELGHNNTERLHLHGLIWTDEDLMEGHENRNEAWNRTTYSKTGQATGWRSTTALIARQWGYGGVHIGRYANKRTVGYIIKYITKVDEDHRGFRPKLKTSAGLGIGYVKKNRHLHRYEGVKTVKVYKLDNGSETGLPPYWRTKLWTDEQRFEMWMKALDSDKIYVRGTLIRERDPIKRAELRRKMDEQRRKELRVIGGEKAPKTMVLWRARKSDKRGQSVKFDDSIWKYEPKAFYCGEFNQKS